MFLSLHKPDHRYIVRETKIFRSFISFHCESLISHEHFFALNLTSGSFPSWFGVFVGNRMQIIPEVFISSYFTMCHLFFVYSMFLPLLLFKPLA